jgi:hypothetical protein
MRNLQLRCDVKVRVYAVSYGETVSKNKSIKKQSVRVDFCSFFPAVTGDHFTYLAGLGYKASWKL